MIIRAMPESQSLAGWAAGYGVVLLLLRQFDSAAVR